MGIWWTPACPLWVMPDVVAGATVAAAANRTSTDSGRIRLCRSIGGLRSTLALVTLAPYWLPFRRGPTLGGDAMLNRRSNQGCFPPPRTSAAVAQDQRGIAVRSSSDSTSTPAPAGVVSLRALLHALYDTPAQSTDLPVR